MNPYQYAEYRNPWAPSIAQVLLHSGDIEAQRAATVAGAQARATEIGGQATAAAVGSIGAHLAGVVDAASNPQRQLAGAQLDAVKRDNRSRLILETELKNPANLKPDGSIDDQAITARLKAQDVGAWQSWSAISSANQKNALDLRAKGAEIAKTTVDTAEKTRQFQQAQADYLGRLAYNGLDALQAKPGDPLHARDTVLAMTARAIVDGGISEGEGKDFLMQTAHHREADGVPDGAAEIRECDARVGRAQSRHRRDRAGLAGAEQTGPDQWAARESRHWRPRRRSGPETGDPAGGAARHLPAGRERRRGLVCAEPDGRPLHVPGRGRHGSRGRDSAGIDSDSYRRRAGARRRWRGRRESARSGDGQQDRSQARDHAERGLSGRDQFRARRQAAGYGPDVGPDRQGAAERGAEQGGGDRGGGRRRHSDRARGVPRECRHAGEAPAAGAGDGEFRQHGDR
jgi:hypothetical protein